MLDIYQEYSNHLEEIFENSFDYIYLHDKKGNIIDVNDVILRNLGYSKKEILKMKVTDFLVEEVISNVINEIDDIVKAGIVNRPKTYKVRKKNGDFVFVEASAIPLRRNGEFYAILGIGHDVSAYKKVEQNLVISEKKYRHLFTQSPFGILLFDSKGNLIESNGVLAQKMSEYAGKDFRGKNFIEIAANFQNSKQIIQMFLNRLKALRQGEVLEPIEFYITTMNGKKLWLHWQSSQFDVDNQSYIQVIIQDITKRKIAEENLKESEEKFRTLFEKADEGIILADKETEKIITGNTKMCEMLGYSLQELKNFYFADLHPNESLHYIDEKFEQELDEISMVNDIPMKRKDGSIFYCNVNSSQIELSGKSYILGFFSDITNRIKAKQKLKESEAKFRVISEESMVGITILQDYVFKYVNQRALHIFGYITEEVNFSESGDFLNNIHPEDRRRAAKQVMREQEGLESGLIHNPFRGIKKDGEIIWIDMYLKSIIFNNKSAVLVVFIDITDQVNAEKKLKESEEKFRSISEQSLMGIFILQDNVYKYINQKYADMIGYPIEEVQNWPPMKFLENVHPDDLEKVMQIEEQVKLGTFEAMDGLQFRAVKKSGELFWSEVYAKNINYEGKNARLFNLVDITSQKEAERKLKESEEKFRTITEQSLIGILILQDDIIKYGNQRVVDILGYPIKFKFESQIEILSVAL